MTQFVAIDLPLEHRGVARIEGAIHHLRDSATRFDAVRSGTPLLLAALVAALMALANQFMDSWSDGHLLASWTLMWLVAFVSMALLATPVRRALVALRGALRAWSEARRRHAEDEATWNAALQDARLMADLSRAMNGIAVEDIRRYR
ncbi:hypothetical protein [Oryzisolibacter sp. LB2S]|uniref:hypothetical protein n=1 Tax=Alicycliphilus soli TaxID=3228789 RepID=UPI003459786C